ncbi:Thiol-disulfide oxidoreductase ResA [Paenibacillus plantiphilus]|uniref:Thiol-disulfide oxidoreductase ResA n=1 Tax=Paenibacillus plantiphilus TaxID=2905650 RepID=A0ABN8FQM2_9BACL|nr:redoxin domain-containing protein [Paenibacillus plantiphilus]CAH1189935.1 Thiol-disulfide oxidoreductase ResA [Paenibacillus plantiphilus]
MHISKKQVTIIIILGILCMAIYLIASYEKPTYAPLKEGGKGALSSSAALTKPIPKKTTPDIELTGMDHVVHKVFYSDKPTVLLFFASWCPYCNEDAPKLVELQEKYRDKVNVYGINVINRDEYKEVAAYIDKHEITYPVLVDKKDEYYNYYGHAGFPSLFFVDRYGEVVDSIIGSADFDFIEDSFQYLIDVDEIGQASLKNSLREESFEDESAEKYLTRLDEDFDENLAARELKAQMVDVVKAFGAMLREKDSAEMETVIDSMVVERSASDELSGRKANKELFEKAMVDRLALDSQDEAENEYASDAWSEEVKQLSNISLGKLVSVEYAKDDSAAQFYYYHKGSDYIAYVEFIRSGDSYLLNEVDVFKPSE